MTLIGPNPIEHCLPVRNRASSINVVRGRLVLRLYHCLDRCRSSDTLAISRQSSEHVRALIDWFA